MIAVVFVFVILFVVLNLYFFVVVVTGLFVARRFIAFLCERKPFCNLMIMYLSCFFLT